MTGFARRISWLEKRGDSGLSEAVRLFKARGQAMKKAAQGEPEVDGASDGPVVRKKN